MAERQSPHLAVPTFLQWLKQFRLPIQPDEQDYDQPAQARTADEHGGQYGLAQARKILRLYGQWKGGLS